MFHITYFLFYNGACQTQTMCQTSGRYTRQTHWGLRRSTTKTFACIKQLFGLGGGHITAWLNTPVADAAQLWHTGPRQDKTLDFQPNVENTLQSSALLSFCNVVRLPVCRRLSVTHEYCDKTDNPRITGLWIAKCLNFSMVSLTTVWILKVIFDGFPRTGLSS